MVPSMASIQRPSLGMDHTHERIAQAAHIIRRIPSQQERERIMQQLEEDGDFNAKGIEAVRRAVGGGLVGPAPKNLIDTNCSTS